MNPVEERKKRNNKLSIATNKQKICKLAKTKKKQKCD
jgi:hypothetical protein